MNEREPLVIYGSEQAHQIRQEHRLLDIVRFWSQYYGVPMMLAPEYSGFLALKPVTEEVLGK